MSESRIIVALDFPDESSVIKLVEQLDPSMCRLKVGKELFTRCGPALVRRLVADGYDVFLDLKYHDIPHTVARACAAAAELGVWMVNVHSMGGVAMMEAAREVLNAEDAPRLIAVTLLTSSGDKELRELGMSLSAEDAVKKLALMAQLAGLDGVVCSAREARVIKNLCGQAFTLVTPGIRPADSRADDQQRIMTPEAAISNGSDYLVIGRPITQSSDPFAALQAINASIAD